jgi:hypothetical protein
VEATVIRDIQILYALRSGDSISAEECTKINEGLAIADPGEVPQDQIENVLSYLDCQFLYQQVEPKLAAALENLVEALRLRI